MLFNSFPFLVFLPTAFAIYWWAGRYRVGVQNVIVLVASYIFYGWWDWRFLTLIFTSSMVDYLVGLNLAKEGRPNRRKLLLGISLTANLGLLAAFKYFGFFVDSFRQLLLAVGVQVHPLTLNIILPVGISFYTFQTLSYTIDLYRGRIAVTRDPISFFAFVSFFPQLVAGPIERAKSLLPQFELRRSFEVSAAKDGLRQILWGLFKKMVVADNLAPRVDYIFGNYSNLDAPTLLLGGFFLPCKYTVTFPATRT